MIVIPSRALRPHRLGNARREPNERVFRVRSPFSAVITSPRAQCNCCAVDRLPGGNQLVRTEIRGALANQSQPRFCRAQDVFASYITNDPGSTIAATSPSNATNASLNNIDGTPVRRGGWFAGTLSWLTLLYVLSCFSALRGHDPQFGRW